MIVLYIPNFFFDFLGQLLKKKDSRIASKIVRFKLLESFYCVKFFSISSCSSFIKQYFTFEPKILDFLFFSFGQNLFRFQFLNKFFLQSKSLFLLPQPTNLLPIDYVSLPRLHHHGFHKLLKKASALR